MKVIPSKTAWKKKKKRQASRICGRRDDCNRYIITFIWTSPSFSLFSLVFEIPDSFLARTRWNLKV